MLSKFNPSVFNDTAWQRINMRRVSHIAGAEMIHNLYNRHWPLINSIRFRHTITNFRNGVVESYAPIEEWQYMQKWLSRKFESLDPILIREINAILQTDYAFTDELITKIDSINIRKLDNSELALLLIDIMDIPLGDIYKLNVVQIEYSLNFAIHNILKDYEPSEIDRNELLSQIIAPGNLTVSQEEDIAFGKILLEGRARKVNDAKSDTKVLKLIKEHHTHYAPLHCAYGEEPPSVADYISRYSNDYKNTTIVKSSEALSSVKQLQKRSRNILARLGDERLLILCELMANIGVFRDQNKAKLGATVVRRLSIIDEISRRTKVPRENLDYYLVSELTELLDTKMILSNTELKHRKVNGVSFIRSEGIQNYTTIAHSDIKPRRTLKGICASKGEANGKVKIVSSKQDADKISRNDIMVAIGTDFDLLEVMGRAAGIITEEGGVLSHASVVSRELGTPCLIGVKDATRILKDGDPIHLDATNGIVELESNK